MKVRYEGAILADGPYVVKVITRDDGNILSRNKLDPRYDLRVHSPDGLSWGYYGSGPAQTALAIVADAISANIALNIYMEFKIRVVALLPMDDTFTLTRDEVRNVINDILEGD